MDPLTGEIKWRVNQVVESVHFDDVAKQIPGAKGWGTKRGSHPGQPFSRAYMSLNTPPMVTRGHLHGGGMLMVNLSDPKDFSFTYSNFEVKELPELSATADGDLDVDGLFD